MEVQRFPFAEGMFVDMIQGEHRDAKIQILEINKNRITAKAINFLSDIYGVSIVYTVNPGPRNLSPKRSIDVFIKTEPSSSKSAADLVHRQDLFSVELRMLRDVLPRIERIVGLQIGPRLRYGSETERVLIMEDLVKQQFVMKDRQMGLPFQHCVLVLRYLAKLHAGSVAVHEQDPKLVESFRTGGIVSTKCPASYTRLMEVSLERISRAMETWEDEKCSNGARKLRNLAATIGKRCMEAYHCEPGEFCVLNHGDCWINNMMFRENHAGQPIALLLVDYQMTVYASPAIDLLYFLYICPEITLKCDRDDQFLEVYLNTLREAMTALRCKTKPPTMEDLKRAIQKRRAYAVFAGIILYLRMIANAEDSEDFDEVLGNLSGETRMDVFKNPEAEVAVRRMIPMMDQRGYLD